MYVIVVGGGKVGYYLVKSLIHTNHEVALIEKSQEKCTAITDDFGAVAICGDGCDPAVLQAAGAERADVIVADTGDDEDNLIVCQVAKNKFNVPRTIARVNNPKNEMIFRKLGIDSTVSSTDLVLSMIEQEVAYGGIAPLIFFKKSGVEMVETVLTADSPAVGKTIRDLSLPGNCLILAVERNGEVIIPDGTTVLQEQDTIFTLLRPELLPELQCILVGRSEAARTSPPGQPR